MLSGEHQNTRVMILYQTNKLTIHKDHINFNFNKTDRSTRCDKCNNAHLKFCISINIQFIKGWVKKNCGMLRLERFKIKGDGGGWSKNFSLHFWMI